MTYQLLVVLCGTNFHSIFIGAREKKLFARSCNSNENFLLGVKNTPLKFHEKKKFLLSPHRRYS